MPKKSKKQKKKISQKRTFVKDQGFSKIVAAKTKNQRKLNSDLGNFFRYDISLIKKDLRKSFLISVVLIGIIFFIARLK